MGRLHVQYVHAHKLEMLRVNFCVHYSTVKIASPWAVRRELKQGQVEISHARSKEVPSQLLLGYARAFRLRLR